MTDTDDSGDDALTDEDYTRAFTKYEPTAEDRRLQEKIQRWTNERYTDLMSDEECDDDEEEAGYSAGHKSQYTSSGHSLESEDVECSEPPSGDPSGRDMLGDLGPEAARLPKPLSPRRPQYPHKRYAAGPSTEFDEAPERQRHLPRERGVFSYRSQQYNRQQQQQRQQQHYRDRRDAPQTLEGYEREFESQRKPRQYFNEFEKWKKEDEMIRQKKRHEECVRLCTKRESERDHEYRDWRRRSIPRPETAPTPRTNARLVRGIRSADGRHYRILNENESDQSADDLGSDLEEPRYRTSPTRSPKEKMVYRSYKQQPAPQPNIIQYRRHYDTAEPQTSRGQTKYRPFPTPQDEVTAAMRRELRKDVYVPHTSKLFYENTPPPPEEREFRHVMQIPRGQLMTEERAVKQWLKENRRPGTYGPVMPTQVSNYLARQKHAQQVCRPGTGVVSPRSPVSQPQSSRPMNLRGGGPCKDKRTLDLAGNQETKGTTQVLRLGQGNMNQPKHPNRGTKEAPEPQLCVDPNDRVFPGPSITNDTSNMNNEPSPGPYYTVDARGRKKYGHHYMYIPVTRVPRRKPPTLTSDKRPPPRHKHQHPERE